MTPKRSRKAYDPFKRTIDLIVASGVFILSLPIQVAVAVFVRIKLGRPVLFRQQRPGKDGRVFTLVKFRSMRDVDEAGGIVSDEDRITRFGQLLRSTSLDELPTLFNVVRGDMSLVGPRPLLVSYLSRYSPEQARRHEVRPGITGLAQVGGRNSLSWDQKFDLDVRYVDSRSWATDFQILVRTVKSVLKRDGITADGEVTMPEFLGNSQSQRSTPTIDNRDQEGNLN